MKNSRSAASIPVSAAASLLAFASIGDAQAQDVYWSVGLSSPGMQVAVNSALPVRVAPPVFIQPRPVYVAPRHPIYMRPLPVFVPPPRYFRSDWRYPGHHRGWQLGEQRGEIERHGHAARDGRG
jgi:hypothetical protein